MRRLCRRCLVIAAAVVLPATLAACSSVARVSWRSGAFAGYLPAQDVAFGGWRGRPINSSTDYLPEDNWSEIEDPQQLIKQWRGNAGLHPNFALAPFPATGGSLATAATGAYDGYFVTLARHLVTAGLGSVAIRLGWEFNASYYRWSVHTPLAARMFAAAWRQIVTAMRSVHGARFTFVWTPNLQQGGVDPALAYPGNAYVSDIGLDVYDWDDGSPSETPSRRWRNLVDARYGLAWQAAFGRTHSLPLAYPEWGVVHYVPDPAAAGGDDPAFIRHMFRWFGTHDVAFEDYFDADVPSLGFDSALNAETGLLPESAAVYRRLWRR